MIYHLTYQLDTSADPRMEGLSTEDVIRLAQDAPSNFLQLVWVDEVIPVTLENTDE